VRALREFVVIAVTVVISIPIVVIAVTNVTGGLGGGRAAAERHMNGG